MSNESFLNTGRGGVHILRVIAVFTQGIYFIELSEKMGGTTSSDYPVYVLGSTYEGMVCVSENEIYISVWFLLHQLLI